MKKKRIACLLSLVTTIVLVTSLGFSMTGCSSKESEFPNKLTYQEVTTENPLKGFVALENDETTFPQSMNYYAFNLNEVQFGYNEFDWTVLEKSLEHSKSEGRQAIIRFYIDYPGMQSGIPSFLIEDGLKVYDYDLDGDVGVCPDYSDKNLQEALVNFINEFAKVYDGDPRIGFIQAGLLGFWGEWHTYPYDDWYPTKELYRAVGKTYGEAFKKTHVMVGEVEESVKDYNLGYHDDSFALDTKYFLGLLEENGISDKWLTKPIGSELAPAIQEDYFKSTISLKNIDWDKSVSLIHASWCINNAILDYEGKEREKAIDAGNKMGYNFTVNSSGVDYENNELQVNIEMKNTGSAPFYYDWDIELKVVDSKGSEVLIEKTDWSLRDATELNKSHIFSYSLKNVKLEDSATYTVSMKVINPMEGGRSLYFANKEQNEDGWLDLITMKVEN